MTTSPPTPGEEDDDSLLARHVDGDPDAFAHLVRRHRDRLWAVAVRTLGDREEAADALQDALVNAYRRAESFRGQSAVTTWLHRIVVNACIDRTRRQAVRAAEALPEGDHHTVLATSPDRDPAEQVALHHDIAAALATLPVEQRSALVLVDMQGYPVEEAAQILGCAVGTVKSRCARGRARLLPLLAPGRVAASSASARPGAAAVGTPAVDGDVTAGSSVDVGTGDWRDAVPEGARGQRAGGNRPAQPAVPPTLDVPAPGGEAR